MPDALTIALRKEGYDVFATKADLVRTIGVGDEVDLIYKRTQNGWVVGLPVKVSSIRVIEERGVEFVAHRRSVQNEEQPEYVLLQVPWTQSTIPPPVGEGGNPIQVRASYSLRRFFEPERPDVQEIQALLDAFPCEFTVTLMDDKGQRREVLLGTTATGTSPLGGGHMDQGEEDSEAEEGESER